MALMQIDVPDEIDDALAHLKIDWKLETKAEVVLRILREHLKKVSK